MTVAQSARSDMALPSHPGGTAHNLTDDRRRCVLSCGPHPRRVKALLSSPTFGGSMMSAPNGEALQVRQTVDTERLDG